jgi:tetratricopeptide (TPR) repeat protein
MLKYRMLHYFSGVVLMIILLQSTLNAQGLISLNASLGGSSATSFMAVGDVSSLVEATIIVARPGSAGKRYNAEIPWITAFVHEYLLFRFGATVKIKIVDPDTLTALIPGYRSYGDPATSESSYLLKNDVVNASHILMTECQLKNGTNAIQFSMKLIPSQGGGNIISVNSSTCELNKIDECLDACVNQLISGLQIEPSTASQKFMTTRVAGDAKCDKTIGSTVIASYSARKPNYKNYAEDLKKCANQGETSLLAYYLSSRYYAKAGDFENAAMVLKDCIFKLGPTDASLYPVCARYFHKAKKLENAFQMIKVAQGLNLVTNDLLVEKAVLLEAMEEENDAEAAYREVITFDPSNFNALLFLMHKANKNGDAATAVEYSKAFRRQYPGDGRGDLEAGKAYLTLQQLPEAQSALARAADILTTDAEPRILLGDVYSAQYNHSAALDQYERALDLAPENVDLHVKIAQTCLLMGKPDMAVETLRKIQKKHYDNPGLLKVLGLAEFRTGDTANALNELSRYVRSGVPDHTVFFTLGELYDNLGEYAQALDYYERAAAIDPSDQASPRRIEAVRQKMSGSEYAEKVKKKKERRESAEQASHLSPRLVIRVGAGVLGVAAAGGGYLMDMLVKKDYNVYRDWENNPEAKNTQRVSELHASIERNKMYRDALYGIAGLCSISIGATFYFH